MTPSQLPRHAGAAVQVTLDGRPALATLSVADDTDVYITSLCYTETKRACPPVQQKLTPQDIESLALRRPKVLTSRIALRSQAA